MDEKSTKGYAKELVDGLFELGTGTTVRPGLKADVTKLPKNPPKPPVTRKDGKYNHIELSTAYPAQAKPLRERFIEEYNNKAGWIRYIIIAVQKPWGGVEIITKTSRLHDESTYILDNYDADFCLKNNKDVRIIDFMII